MADVSAVRVETVEIDHSGTRQISGRTRPTVPLAEHTPQVRAAISAASEIVQDSLESMRPRAGWQVSTLEVTFGITLAADTSIIVSKASAAASFEVKLTVERTE